LNYPVWYLPGVGGGLLIASIAIIHVFISHFAVGGGLYLVFAERKGLREKSRAILDFTRSHAKFFLLMTVVAGGVTGVAIWFIIGTTPRERRPGGTCSITSRCSTIDCVGTRTSDTAPRQSSRS